MPYIDSDKRLITPETIKFIPSPAIKGFSFSFATPKAARKMKTKLHKKVKAKAAGRLPKVVEKRKNKIS